MHIKANCIEVIVYKSALKEDKFYNSKVVNDMETFKVETKGILASRKTEALSVVADKLCKSNLFGSD